MTFLNAVLNQTIFNSFRTCLPYLLGFITLLQSISCAAAIRDGRWHPGIGDPTVYGWITVLFYLLAALLSAARIRTLKIQQQPYLFWLFLAALLLFLGINKQLDLQSWLTQTVKDQALLHGWYAQRRLLQMTFVGMLSIGMIVFLIGSSILLRDSWHENKLSWIGIVLLCTFILIRAASFHHMDLFIHHQILGLKVNVIMEIGALLMIITDAIYKRRSDKIR